MAVSGVPDAALDDRLAFVGTSGSGKTYAAGTAVERLLKAKARVVIVDPLDVWWGLRLQPDGETSAFPVVIFGGAHADLPLTEQAGALIGETVAGMAESCIVSLGGLSTKSAERRFMLAFLERLYRSATGEPFHIIFDEADLWAPQKSSEPQLQNLMEQIVRRGRVKGFIPWLITQRPAVLSKDVLSQADGLIAMKLTSSQDRDAIGGWIEGQADRADEKRILARLPQLQRGRGVVWIPGRGILDEVAFPRKVTFDSSRTPKRGELVRSAVLKPIDIGAVKARLAALEADAARPEPTPRTVSQPAVHISERALKEAEDRGRRIGFEDGKRVGFAEGYRAAQKDAQLALAALKPADENLAAMPQRPSKAKPEAASARASAAALDGSLGTLASRLLDEARARWPVRLTWAQLATLCKRKARGGAFNTARKELLGGGHVREDGPFVVPTEVEDRPAPTREDMIEIWVAALPTPANEIFRVIADAPEPMAAEEIAARTNRQPRGGSWNTALSILRSNGLIEEIGRGAFIVSLPSAATRQEARR